MPPAQLVSPSARDFGAAYISRHGGLLSDDMERQIMQRIAGDRRRSV